MLLVLGTSVLAVGADKDVWSPYYRITGCDRDGQQVSLHPEDGATPWFLSVDGIPHQAMVASDEAAQSDLHRQVYAWFPERRFDQTLIVGAGTGTDTSLALAEGAGHVAAVEIDPAIRHASGPPSTRNVSMTTRASPSPSTTGGRSCGRPTSSTTSSSSPSPTP